MSTRTTFLSLVLPELNEFVNSWNAPVNQNTESIDDFCSDLYESLVGSSATSTWAALRGSLGSLADRLDVSISADGTLDLSSSPELLGIASSSVTGAFTTPVDRLNDTDSILYDAGLPATGSRFVPIPATGPAAGFPHAGDLEAGIAIRSADFGVTGSQPISSPARPWAPGLVTGGGSSFITAVAEGSVQLNGSAAPALFNIDGFVFRLREDVLFDYNLLAPAADQYVWIYIERVEASYNTANFRYGAAVAAKDLRVLQSSTAGGGLGQTSGSTFQAASSTFNTAALGKVKSGDVLVIDGGAAAGEYVIDSVTSDLILVIKGVFKADLASLSWHVQDNWHPNIGAVVTTTDPTVRPAFVAGRVYIGRVKHQVAAPPTSPVTFTAGGVYDSEWQFAMPTQTRQHNLGAVPSSVEVWVRVDATGDAYRPLVRRSVMTNFDSANATVEIGDIKSATLLFPSLYVHATEVSVTVTLLNASTDPSKPVAYFTDSAGVDQTAGQLRIVARR